LEYSNKLEPRSNVKVMFATVRSWPRKKLKKKKAASLKLQATSSLTGEMGYSRINL